jgi:tetratricopeptide (TPR) repeat protein
MVLNMKINLNFEQLSHYDHHAHALEYGHQGPTRSLLAQAKVTNNQPVNDWLAAKLKHKWPLSSVNQWPPVMAQQWHGWQAYYQGSYAQSAQHFTRAWDLVAQGEAELGFISDIALGLGKVYTRTGHWQAARRWLIYCLSEARCQNNLFNVTQGYGALGELLLRAGHPQEALACFNTAFHVLPTGSGQQSKQLNYLSSALIRNNAWLRAESLIKTSIQNAKDMAGREGASQEASDSIHHALARLQFLELARHQSDITHAPDVLVDWGEKLNINTLLRTPVAEGFLAVGRALRCEALNQTENALMLLAQAQQHFNQQFPMEHYWAERLLQRLLGQPFVVCEKITQLMTLAVITPPSNSSVLDETWQRPNIANSNGFAALIEPKNSFLAFSQQWQLFFL